MSLEFVKKGMKKLISFVLMFNFLFLFFNAYTISSNVFAMDERIIYFGKYPQSKITNVDNLINKEDYIEKDGKFYKLEPIKWRIIKEDTTSLLVVSEDNLDVRLFSVNYSGQASWGDSDVAKWLNSDTNGSFDHSVFAQNGFLLSAFTVDEISKIIPSTVSYTELIKVPFSKVSGNTKFVCGQKMFLLSQSDFNGQNLYNINNFNMTARNTDFVNSYRDRSLGRINNYWLRDTVSENTLLDSFETAFLVSSDNKIETKWVEHNSCIRPAMRVEKSVLKKYN